MANPFWEHNIREAYSFWKRKTYVFQFHTEWRTAKRKPLMGCQRSPMPDSEVQGADSIWERRT